MREKTYRTALVIVPPRRLWEPVQEIRERYDRQVRRWMPHITLIYPFRPRAAFARLSPALTRVCAGITPFRVHLRHFRYFHHGRGRYTLWLAPVPEEPLCGLQESLTRVLPDCDEVRRFPNGYTPHLGVAQVRGRGPMKALRARLQAQWPGIAFDVRGVSLIWREAPPEDVFRVDRTIALGAEPGAAKAPAQGRDREARP